MLRFLLWRMLGLIAAAAGGALLAWFLGGGAGRLLRGAPHSPAGRLTPHLVASALADDVRGAWDWAPAGRLAPARALLALASLATLAIVLSRACARRRRRYVRMRVAPYRGDHADVAALVRMFDSVQFLDSPGARESDGGELDGESGGTREDALVF